MSLDLYMSYAVSYSVSSFLFFFFFQAEDGIRDLIVTGVQTCALPILSTHEVGKKLVELCAAGKYLEAIDALYAPNIISLEAAAMPGMPARVEGLRSEERRVGKECRSRWSPYH